MNHPLKPIAQINKLAEKIELPTNAELQKIPTADELSNGIKPFAPILIVIIQFVKIFTNDETDAKLEALILLLQKA